MMTQYKFFFFNDGNDEHDSITTHADNIREAIDNYEEITGMDSSTIEKLEING